MEKLNSLLQSVKPFDFEVEELKKKGRKEKPEKTEKSELEILVHRKQNEMRKKAQYHWSLLRESVCSVRKAVEESDLKNLVITHGIHRERKMNHHKKITQVLYIPQHKEYLTCDGQNFRFFHEDGRKKDIVDTEEGMNRVIYSNQTNQFVGWVHGQEDLYLMSREFVIGSQSKAVGKILMGTYNNNTGELITVGPNFITCWAFRYGARHLIPRKTTKTNFGERKMFKMMVLEETASKSQRIFFAQGTGVVVFNVYSGLEMCHKRELHAQPVTAITFFNPLKYVITGAQDGCIKVWDSQWRVQMVFVGHNGQVNHLKIYPHGPAFISASLDCTIRVWNMETCDEIDKTVISEPIEGIGTEMNYDIFYTFAGKRVDLWKLQHLFQIHTNIGYRINAIQVTNHPAHPVRAVLLCRDSSIRLVCPTNGEVITTLLMKPAYGLVDAAYAIAEDTLFALLGNGDIVKSRTDQNPCQIVSRWKCDNPREMCSCLLVYEYVVDPTGSGDVWAMMKRSVATKTVQVVGDNTTGSSAPGSSNKNRTLLLGGRKDGYICVFDWHTGEVTFKVEAHGSKGVLNMIANSKADQLVSAGMDNIIKVWRLYPFAQEALAPLMSFYCAHTPSFMTTIKSSMGVAFQDPSTATFSVVLYSLPEKTQENKLLGSLGHRNDHKPDDDHMDIITGLTCCPRMKLYASCSMDGTIRIWSNENVLVRLLKINTIPHSIAFCSPKGDLLVGLSNHLFFISHTKYLPKSYLRKQVCMRFGRERSELPLAFDDNKINTMEKNDVKRLKNSHASFKFTHFVDILSAEEQEEVMREKQIRAEAYGQLEIRENELQQIRDGALTTKHKFKGNKKTQNRAFREYMKMYYNKPREKLPLDEETGVTLAKQQAAEKDSDDEEDDTYRPDTAPYGFFSELSHSGTSPGEEPCYPSGPSGYLPNSVLVKILYPPPPPTPASRDATPYQPLVLTPGQLAEIQSLHSKKFGRRDSELDISAVSRNVTFAADDHLTRVLELELSDEEDKKAVDPDSAEPPEATTSFEFDESMRGQIDSANASSGGAATIATPARSSAMTVRTFSDLPDSRPLTTPKTPAKSRLPRKKTKSSFFDESDEDDDDMFGGMSQKSTSLMSKFQEIMDEPPPPKIQEEPMEGAEPTVKVKELDEAEEPEEPTPSPVKRPPAGLSKPITKLISRPPPKAATPPPPRSPTPPPPPTPLPNFIKQFVGAEWFDKYFPNCNENTMPKPWTADVFVNMIVKLIRIADFVHKVGVVDAILSVHAQEGLSGNVEAVVVKTLLAVLNHHTNPPSCAQPDQRNFILASLRALTVFGIKDKDVLAELMVQFLDGDKDVRSQVVEVLTNFGLVDPHKQFQKELDSWDIWSIDEKNHLDELHKMSNQWLDRWMASYKMRIKDTVEKLQQGHSLHGRLSNRGSMAPGASRRGSMMPGDNETVTSLPGGSLKIPDTARTGRMSSMSHSSVTVTLDRLQGSSILESVSYLDAITYFCEMMTEKELEALRRGETLRGGGSDKVVQAKNTVLVLPKIQHKPALVRLGEMHTSKCRPERETALHTDFRMPPISTRGGFVSAINLPMKPVYLNPFPCAIDDFEPYFQQPVLITLKSSQKYFIPAQSYVPLEEHVAVGT